MEKHLRTIFSVRLLMLALWCGVIFAFSEMPGSGSNAEPPLWYVLERKSAHVFEYAVLALLTFRYFSVIFSRETLTRIILVTASFSLVYGVLDELHQFFVFGRGARFTDVLVDGIGIALALLAVTLFRRGR
ncbi:MAG: VanZ family protein [Undibacterium sp.]